MGKSEDMNDSVIPSALAAMQQGGAVGVRRVPMYQPKDGDAIKIMPSHRAQNLAKGSTLTAEQVDELIRVAERFNVVITDVMDAVAKGMQVIGNAFDHVRDMVHHALESKGLRQLTAALAAEQARYLPGVVRSAIRLGRTRDFAVVWDGTRKYTRRGRVYMPIVLVMYETTQIHDSITITYGFEGMPLGERRWRKADVEFFNGLGFDCILRKDEDGTNLEMSCAALGRHNTGPDGFPSGRMFSTAPNVQSIPRKSAPTLVVKPEDRGPVNEPVEIKSFDEFVSTYGTFEPGDES